MTGSLGSAVVKNPPPDLAGRLLEVGEQVLHAEPPLRFEDVAHLVGASRAALYYYFSGRDDLVSFLLTAHTGQAAAAVGAAVDPADPAEVRLTATLRALAGYLGGCPGMCAGLVVALGGAGRMGEALRALDTAVTAPLRALLADGARTGALVAADPADSANALIGGLLLAVIGRSLTGADTTDPAFHRTVTDQLARGVLT
jgi:AcrR family transcriptional regulator